MRELFYREYFKATDQEPRSYNIPHEETIHAKFFFKGLSQKAIRLVSDKRRELGGFYSITESGCPYIGVHGKRYVYFGKTRSFKCFNV